MCARKRAHVHITWWSDGRSEDLQAGCGDWNEISEKAQRLRIRLLECRASDTQPRRLISTTHQQLGAGSHAPSKALPLKRLVRRRRAGVGGLKPAASDQMAGDRVSRENPAAEAEEDPRRDLNGKPNKCDPA